jgi:hypothetical protein
MREMGIGQDWASSEQDQKHRPPQCLYLEPDQVRRSSLAQSHATKYLRMSPGEANPFWLDPLPLQQSKLRLHTVGGARRLQIVDWTSPSPVRIRQISLQARDALEEAPWFTLKRCSIRATLANGGFTASTVGRSTFSTSRKAVDQLAAGRYMKRRRTGRAVEFFAQPRDSRDARWRP